MRPQQQNRRMRGRGNGGGGNNNNNNNNNNNRKGPNPLTRSYESNGPDVKIRGTAQQIAEKYTTLARDAQSSGDRVIGENYLQHAEHYNRLIAAAQAQLQPQQNMRDNRDDGDEEADERDDRDERDERDEQQEVSQSYNQQGNQQRNQQRPRFNDGSGPQPVIEGVPAEVALKDRQLNGGNSGRPNGRGDMGGRRHPGAEGQGGEAPGQAEPVARTDVETGAVDSAPAATESRAEAAPQPVKRPRRPRAKKADAAGTADAAPAAEEVTSS